MENFVPQRIGELIHVENALIEEIVALTERSGYILISYQQEDESNMSYMQVLRLNIGDETLIIDEMGEELSVYDLEEGMRIAAVFSSAMTRSIPPQSFAYRIVVLQAEALMDITIDRVVSVDVNNGFILTGNPYDINDQLIFTISNETVILDQGNSTIPLAAIQPGQLIWVEHAIFQTLSIPPQSPAYRVQMI